MVKKKSKMKEDTKVTQIHKRKIEDEIILGSKKICDEMNNDNKSGISFNEQYIQKLFLDMKNSAPQVYNTFEKQVPDYCVFTASNKSRTDYDFNLIIW